MGLNVFYNILGLIRGKRWGKASKCKRLIKQLRSRLTVKKSRTNAIIRQLRADIAQLMQKGLHHVVSTRVEQLYRDYCRLYAYDQLEGFCECICTNLRDISRGRKLSVEVHEALSTLIFASSRCGELPELHSIRNLFKQHFGQKFERVNVELLPGNAVNSEIKNNLTILSVTEEVKLQLTNEIATEFTHQSAVGRPKSAKLPLPGTPEGKFD
ncbi:Regulator of Vps4 activity in the MVB pathway protein [Abeliophyllum distichum]|uniref:Regulator of Vps4 activity in the MVB pathway protein n=1 Tax=Abeliophyllum distichum TaxID=126358 RepID=A0ABD1QJ56_9LAMI